MQTYEIQVTDNDKEQILETLIVKGEHSEFMELRKECFSIAWSDGRYWFETDDETYITLIFMNADRTFSCRLVDTKTQAGLPELKVDSIWQMHSLIHPKAFNPHPC